MHRMAVTQFIFENNTQMHITAELVLLHCYFQLCYFFLSSLSECSRWKCIRQNVEDFLSELIGSTMN